MAGNSAGRWAAKMAGRTVVVRVAASVGKTVVKKVEWKAHK